MGGKRLSIMRMDGIGQQIILKWDGMRMPVPASRGKMIKRLVGLFICINRNSRNHLAGVTSISILFKVRKG